MRRKHRELALLVKRIVEIKRVGYDVKAGRTIGLVVPDEIRGRLEHMRISHHIRSYRHTVLVALRLGLVELERAGESPPVESLRPGRRDPDRSILDTEPPSMFPDRPHPVSVVAPTLPVSEDEELEGWERDELDDPKEKPAEGLDFGSLSWDGPDRDRNR